MTPKTRAQLRNHSFRNNSFKQQQQAHHQPLVMPPEAKEATTPSTNEDSSDTASKPSLQLIVDYSKAKVTPLHVLCMALWSGWMAFYVYFPPLIPVLWIYCPWLLAAIVTFVIFSATYSYKEKHQPKVS